MCGDFFNFHKYTAHHRLSMSSSNLLHNRETGKPSSDQDRRNSTVQSLATLADEHSLHDVVPWLVQRVLRLPLEIYATEERCYLAADARADSRDATCHGDRPEVPGIQLQHLIWRLAEYLRIDQPIYGYLRDVECDGLAAAVHAAIADVYGDIDEHELVELAEHDRVVTDLIRLDLAP